MQQHQALGCQKIKSNLLLNPLMRTEILQVHQLLALPWKASKEKEKQSDISNYSAVNRRCKTSLNFSIFTPQDKCGCSGVQTVS